MSYTTMHRCANDSALQNRVVAAIADEGRADPQTVMLDVIWPVATASDIAAAYESAVIANNPNPGGDPAVITDAQILSVVQASLPPVVVP